MIVICISKQTLNLVTLIQNQMHNKEQHMYLVVYIPAASAVAPPTVISNLSLSVNKALRPPVYCKKSADIISKHKDQLIIYK